MISMNNSLHTPETFLVGFGNKARHGKDYLANAVHCLLPHQTKIYSLSSAMKAWARVQGWMTDKDGALLQMLGTDIFRARVDPLIWIRTLSMQIREEAPEVALITDIRFQNEANWVQRTNAGWLMRVKRLNADETPYESPDRPSSHLSETDLDTWPAWTCTYEAVSGDLATLDAGAYSLAEDLTALLTRRDEVPLDMACGGRYK